MCMCMLCPQFELRMCCVLPYLTMWLVSQHLHQIVLFVHEGHVGASPAHYCHWSMAWCKAGQGLHAQMLQPIHDNGEIHTQMVQISDQGHYNFCMCLEFIFEISTLGHNALGHLKMNRLRFWLALVQFGWSAAARI